MWHVRVEQIGFARTITLLIANQMEHNANVLMKDGSWYTVQNGTALPQDVGFDLPADCLRELAHALNDHLGDTRTNADLQAELRNEQRRVDDLHKGILQALRNDHEPNYANGGYLTANLPPAYSTPIGKTP